MLTPRRRWGAAVTPSTTALISRGLGVPSLDKSEGVASLLGVPPHTIGSATIVMSTTPSRPSATLRSNSVPLSDGAGPCPRSLWPLSARGSDLGAPLPQAFSGIDEHLQV
jgi:hypothetical protein